MSLEFAGANVSHSYTATLFICFSILVMPYLWVRNFFHTTSSAGSDVFMRVARGQECKSGLMRK